VAFLLLVFFIIQSDSEESSAFCIAVMHGEEDSSLALRITKQDGAEAFAHMFRVPQHDNRAQAKKKN
jgi:hypothetical protein